MLKYPRGGLGGPPSFVDCWSISVVVIELWAVEVVLSSIKLVNYIQITTVHGSTQSTIHYDMQQVYQACRFFTNVLCFPAGCLLF
jgi:hypothetical protein